MMMDVMCHTFSSLSYDCWYHSVCSFSTKERASFIAIQNQHRKHPFYELTNRNSPTMRSLSLAVFVASSSWTLTQSLMLPKKKNNSIRTRSSSSVAKPAALLFLDGIRELGYSKPSTASRKSDTTDLGNLRVPTVGIGTISWSSTNRKTLPLSSLFFCDVLLYQLDNLELTKA